MIFVPTEVIGHRGFGRGTVAGLVENTPESCAAAAAHGASWVEIDVRRSADDVLLAYHNAALPDGRLIVDLPAAEARAAGVATLDEVLEAIPSDIGLDFDVKTVLEDAVDPPARRTVSLLAPYLKRHARLQRVFVCSFDPSALLAVQEQVPGVATAWMPFVRNPVDHALAGAVALGCALVAVDARSFGLGGEPERPGRRSIEETVATAHRAGLQVVSWCPDPADSARLAAAGVAAVVVDDVPGTVQALTATAASSA